MGQRHLARCVALEVLYASEIGGRENFEHNFRYCCMLHKLSNGAVEFARRLVEAVFAHTEEIDNAIKETLQNWDFSRLAVVDRNIIRLGIAELRYIPDTPLKVAIDESIELAKKYGSADSGRFVNGVLDAVGTKKG